MARPPILFDRNALARNRARAAREPVRFLHDIVAEEVQDRLAMVNRAFTEVAVVSPFPALWAEHMPDARQQPEGEALDLEPESQDLILHLLSLHWANDPVGQMIQCRRALRPDGLFLAAAFGGQTLAELRACLAEAEVQVTGGLSPRVAPMAEIRDLGALLQRAGLALPVADSVTIRPRYRDALHLMHDLRAMGEGNALADRLRRPTRREVLARAAALYGERFADGDGRVTASFELIFLTGWAPDDSQQRPLRPGSAAARLADALNTDETPLRE